jgi:flagellin-like hook-associated protein FlgL
MASNITLSAGVRQNLLSLQNTADLMSQTQYRLATGKKVNSALDNPTNFFTSQSLQSRSADMAALLDNMNTGIKTLEAADNGLTAITKTIESMQSTMRQARQDKSFKGGSYALNIPTAPVGNEMITFSGGALGALSKQISLSKPAGAASAGTVSGISPYPALGIDFATTGQTAGSSSFTYAADATAFTGTDTVEFDIEVDGSGTPVTVTIDQAIVQGVGNADSTIDTISEWEAAVEAGLAAAGVTGVTVTNDGTDVTITSNTLGSTSNVAITNATADADGGGNANTLYGLANDAGTPGTDSVKNLAFNLTVDGGAAVPISIAVADVQGVGNGDSVLSAAEFTQLVNAELGYNGATVSPSGDISFASSTVGGASSMALSGLTETNLPFATGLANASDTGTAAGATIVPRSVDELVAAINSDTDLKDKIRASNDLGKLRIENISTQELEVAGLTNGSIDGGIGTASIEGNAVRANLVKQFNDLRDQLDKLADDASYNGINLLRGDLLKLTFNEIGSSTIEIQARDLDNQERPINATELALTYAQEPEFDSDDLIDVRLESLASALGVIRSQASAFGSNLSIVENRTEFTKAMINTLQTGADALVLADTNEEGANMLALQTRQQLSSTALSLAAQADQAVLRLFG